VVVALLLSSFRSRILPGTLPHLAAWKLETLRCDTHNSGCHECDFWLRLHKKCCLVALLFDISFSYKYQDARE
jgi:hypothetical protein